MPYFQFISPSSSLLARRAEGGTHTQPPPPMHIDLPGIQNRPFRAQRAYTPRAGSPYIRGVRRSGTHEVLGGILVCVLG